MKSTIDVEAVQRIFNAENELRAAIDAAAKSGVVVEIQVQRYASGTQSLNVLVKQIVFP